MSLPPPPGLRSEPMSVAHSSLPARPPPATKATTSQGSSIVATTAETRISNNAKQHGHLPASAGHGPAFPPRSVFSQHSHTRPQSPTVAATPTPSSVVASSQPSRVGPFSQSQFSSQRAPSLNESYISSMPAQLQNPFPLPGSTPNTLSNPLASEGMDPELEAQIAQWQSAYTSKDSHSTGANRAFSSKWTEGATPSTGANSATLGTRYDALASSVPATANTDTGVAEVVTAADGKQKTVVRQGGGQTWQDPSLLEWDPAHFRLFVGNLAGEVTDDSLLKAFSKYPSIQKARVVRDKRTTKSKGYGFVSFADGDQYFQAARDMQGKYIGSHPVLLRKSTTEIRPTVPKAGRHRGKRGKGGSDTVGVDPGSANGVQKKQSKFKNGLKVIG